VNQRRKLRLCNWGWGELNTQALLQLLQLFIAGIQKTLTTKKLLDEMHLHWRLAGGKLKEDKDSDNED
jgi:hypothetical protein